MSRADFTLRRDVAIDDILLDEGNPRIRAGSGQSDCIARVLRKREQMHKLLESIAEEGLSTVPILVTAAEMEPGKWVVKDGNRRITALKLLNDPKLCADEDLRNQIQWVKKAHRKNIPRAIDCLSSDNQQAIVREVILRHSGALGGIGQLDWSAFLRTIYFLNNDLPADYKRAGQYLLWAEQHGVAVDDEFPITTVSRFFSVENIRALGFDVKKDVLALNVADDIAVQMAKRVVEDFGTERLKVDNVFTPDSARGYLDTVRTDAGLLAVQSAPGVAPPAKAAPSSSALPGSATATAKRPNVGVAAPSATSAPVGRRVPSRPNWDRSKLFWTASPAPPVPLTEIKARNILYEIKQIKDVRSCPLTTAFLLRALIELSERHYRGKHKLKDKNKLADNIAAVCDAMTNGSVLTSSQAKVVKSYTVTKADEIGILNVDTLQKYLHRETHFPAAQTINTIWDEFSPFVRACWA